MTRWEVNAAGLTRVTAGEHASARSALEEMLGTGPVAPAYRDARARPVGGGDWITLEVACAQACPYCAAPCERDASQVNGLRPLEGGCTFCKGEMPDG